MADALTPLAPCPFCNGAAELACVSDNYTLRGRRMYPHCARCTKCGVRTEGTAFRNDSYNTMCWNRRVAADSPSAPSQASLDQLEAIGSWLTEAGKHGMAEELLALHAVLTSPETAPAAH
jgi:hypothetical protein